MYINDFEVLKFPNEAKWQLEELWIRTFPDDQIDEQNFKQFLQNQQSTLKKFIFEGSRNYAYFVIRNLPNLEHLHLYIEHDEEFDDSFLLQNNNLQRLEIEMFCEDKSNIFKAILNHYKRIKYLSIIYDDFGDNDIPFHQLSFDLKFE